MFGKTIAAVLAAGLMLAPLPMTTGSAAAQTTSAKPAKKPPSAGQQAVRERQRKCGAEWKEAKKAGKVEKGLTWPKYWSACNKRLKAGG